MFGKKKTELQFKYDLLFRDYARLEKENARLSTRLQVAESQKEEYAKLNAQLNELKPKYEKNLKALDEIRKEYKKQLESLKKQIETEA